MVNKELSDEDRNTRCSLCGDELFCGEPCYIYEGEAYCMQCAISCDIVYSAIEIDYTL